MTKILQGDCLQVMKTMENNSVDTIITDPPYGLSFMGKKRDYDVPSVEIWQEALRVLKPGGTALIFAGSRTQHRMACNVEDAGFVLKDTIMWMYGSGFPKSHNVAKAVDKMQGNEREVVGIDEVAKAKANKSASGEMNARYRNSEAANDNGATITKGQTEREGRGTALKPSYEPILVCQKPNDGTYANNAIKRGVSGLWIEGGRIGTSENLQRPFGTPSDHVGQLKGLKQGELNPKSSGRFPANTILTHNAECKCVGVKEMKATCGKIKDHIKNVSTDKDFASKRVYEFNGYQNENGKETVPSYNCHPDCPVAVLDRQSGVSKSTAGVRKNSYKNGVALYDGKAKDVYSGHNDKGGASRFFKQTERDPTIDRIIYKAKASKKERNKGCEELEAKFSPTMGDGLGNKTHNKETATKKQNNHPTVKPISVMEYLCILTKTPTGGIVLDPFAGSGTTGIACKNTGRDCILIEREEEYIEIIKKRLEITS